jgi:GNAT superfamily N-acetyltransferase
MIAIRSADPSDAPALAELRWEFRAGKESPVEQHDAFVDRCTIWMSAALQGGAWHAWVAERDRAIIGQVWLHPLSKIPNPNGERDRHAYISNVYVTPSARGGIGTRLLNTAIAWASNHHVDRIVLWPTPRSRSMYVRRGFTPNGDVLELDCAAHSTLNSQSSTFK